MAALMCSYSTGRCELLPRVAVLLVGLVASLVLVYFAEKGRLRLAELVGGHTVRFNSDEGGWMCRDEDCSFTAAATSSKRSESARQ